MTTQPTRKNRVFVSYCWDSPEHMARVLALASHLRKKGFDARLDQWESPAPVDGWPAWCSRQVLRADWIVMVCTPHYFERFHGMTLPGILGGVQWESRTIQNRAYYHTLRAGFVPLVFSGSGAEFVPPVALGNAVPLQWPKNDAWDTSEILNRLVPEGDRQGWPALEIPVPKAEAKAAAIPTARADDFGPSVITDDIVSRLLKIDDRIEALAKAYQERHNPPGLIQDDYSWPSSASQDPSFAELRYEQRWLEYRPSPDAEARIERFLNDPRDWLWWGVVAPGGVGKSRFGLELIKKAHGRGWDVAFSNDSTETEWLERDHKGWRPRKPTLLVYDYANFRGQKIIQVLKGLRDSLRNKYFPPVRILLLDRPGGIGQPPGEITTGWETTWRNVRESLYVEPRSAPPTTDERELALARPESQTDRRPLARDDELLRLELPERADWPGILADIVRTATGGSASLTFPPLSDTNWWDKVDRLTHSGRMLHLQLLGIVMARAGNVSIEWISNEKGRHDLLDEMLEYERKHRWVLLCVPKMRGEESEILGNPRFNALIKAAGFVTLNRGLSLGTDEEKLLIDTTGVEARDFRILRNILRYRDDLADPDKSDATIERFEPLEPDLLGEWLLIKLIQPFFSKQDEREQLSTHCRLNMDPAGFVKAAIQTNPLGLAQTLGLMVDDFPNDPGTLRWFCAVLEAFASVSLADEESNLAIVQARLEAAQAVSRFSMQQTDDTGWKPTFDQFASVAPFDLLIGFLLQSESGCAADPSRMWHRQFLELAASTIRASYSSFAAFIDHLPAQAAINAIGYYGRTGRFDELERWGEVVNALVERFPADPAIGLEQAQAAANAIKAYGQAGRFDKLERWGEVLAAAFARFPADAAIGLIQAQAAFNVITGYGQAGRSDELERWGEVLASAVVRFPADTAIGLKQAKAAVNAIIYYGQAGRFDELERWGKVVAAAFARFPADAAFGLEQANAAVTAISYYGQAGRFDGLERWGSLLSAAVARFPADAAIGLNETQAAYNAITAYGQAGRFDDLERWGVVLSSAASRFPADAAIGLEQAQGAYNAITVYGRAGRFDELERWGEVLAAAVARFPADAEIELEQAQAAYNAITVYGRAGRFDELERWCATFESAVARSNITPELFGQTLGMTIRLHNPNKPVTAAPFMAVARYWPGYVVNTANGNAELCRLMAEIDKAASDLHLSRLARTYEIYNAFARNQYSSIEAAQAAMRELWPLRMYLPDRGDGLVPLLGQLGLDDLVAEAARDPWRRASEKTPRS